MEIFDFCLQRDYHKSVLLVPSVTERSCLETQKANRHRNKGSVTETILKKNPCFCQKVNFSEALDCVRYYGGFLNGPGEVYLTAVASEQEQKNKGFLKCCLKQTG